MQSTEFIIERLKVWKYKFPTLKFQYAYDNRAQEHDVVVERGEVYSSKEFQDEVVALWRDFAKEFKGEELIITPPTDPRDDGTRDDLNNVLFQYGYDN